MILTVKCKFDQCTSETSVETDDVDIGAYLSELDHDGWIFSDGTDIAYSISDAELEGYCPFAHGAVRNTKGGNHVIKILPVFLAAVLFLGGCASMGPRQVLSESLTTEDKSKIIDVVRKHGYDRVQETSWTNFQTGNRYTMYPRWRNDTHHVFALHAVVGGKSTTGGKLIQGYGHVFQDKGLWMVADQFSDIQMLSGQEKRVRRRGYFYLNVRKQ